MALAAGNMSRVRLVRQASVRAMKAGQHLFPGLALAPLLAAPARAECFGNCGYGTAIAIVAGVGLAAVALVVWIMIRLGIGWLIKWLVGAGALILTIPPLIITALHARSTYAFEQRDHVGTLPRLADKTPLVLFGNALASCPAALERYVTSWAREGVLGVEVWPLHSVDFTRPVRLADLPLHLHVGAPALSDDPDYGGTYDGYSHHMRPLSPQDRQAAAARIDYVIIAECHDNGGLFDAFRDNPALLATTERYSVELAMAPLDPGSGLLSVRDLQFDLLDLQYEGVTSGFLFASYRIGGPNTAPYDPAALAAALCTKADGTIMPDCVD